MSRANLLWFLAPLLILSACLTPEQRPAQLQAIARWQDQRLAPADSLHAMLANGDAHVRLAAVRAAGLIGRSDILPQVTDALTDQSLTVRAEAAWALGLIGDPAALPALAEASTDARPLLREAAVAALGQLENDGTTLLVAAAHEDAATAALAWNSLRNQAARVDSTTLQQAIVSGLTRPEGDIRWRVLRCAELVPAPSLVPVLAPFVQSGNAQIVVHAYRALSRQTGPDALAAVLAGRSHLAKFRGRDRSRVGIAACRALGALGGQTPLAEETALAVATGLITAAGSQEPHLAETALAAMARLVADQPLPPAAAQQESLLPVWRIRLTRSARSHLESPHVGVRAAALTALGALRGAGAGPELAAALVPELSPHVLAAGLAALAAHAPHPGPTLASYCGPVFRSRLADKNGRPNNAMVRAAALTGLNDLRLNRPEQALPPVDADRIEGLLLTASTDADFVVSTTAAGLLGTVAGDEALLALTTLWHRAEGPGRQEIRRGVLAGLTTMFSPETTGSTATWQAAEELREEARQVLRESFDSADIRLRREGRQAALDTKLLPTELIPTEGSLLATLPAVVRYPRQPPVARPFKAPQIRCVTERGTFTIDLDGKLAPNTCALFLSLIERDYFGAMTFHRVVPDFVVQGGDPDGNGWGGPGFTIRSEWSRARYGRGAVGIAHDGKDTGGSQFFVTLSPQPHLNGRYTIFGWVKKGMDVVDRIEVGDTFRLELAD